MGFIRAVDRFRRVASTGAERAPVGVSTAAFADTHRRQRPTAGNGHGVETATTTPQRAMSPMPFPLDARPLRHFLLAAFSLAALLAAPAGAAETAVAERVPLMQGTRYRAGIDIAAYWVSEKLDGVRGRWDGRALWTRRGQRIATPAWFTRGWPNQPMDGELWIARGEFDAVSALIRRHAQDDPAWRRTRFMLFDLPTHGGTFSARVRAMQALVDALDHPHLAMIAQHRLDGAAALDRQLHSVLALGGEGLMLQHADAYYRDGRSDALLKLTPHDDAEARVVGHTPGRGKYRGKTGALVVEREDGRRFRLGSGLSDRDRDDPPPIGSLVTYRFNGLTSTGLPRFARYLRVRHD